MDEKKHQNYTEEQIRKAIDDVEKGMSIRKAANLHKISRTTLQRKMKNDETSLATKKGPRPIFCAEQEDMIAHWIKSIANAGFPITKKMLMFSMGKLAKECEVTFPGGDLPGRKWFEAFLRRHPDVSLRYNQNFTAQRLSVSQENIDKWFLETENYLKANKLDEVLHNPQRVFSCDETAFFLNPKPGSVLAKKGSRQIYTATAANEKMNLTVLLTANAAGDIAPPMVVYRYDRIPEQLTAATPPGWCIGKSENGWITQEAFYEYITKSFEPYLTEQCIERPVILFIDGHSFYISMHLSMFCINHGIQMVALFPNATHLLQPIDVAVFHTLETTWGQEVANFSIDDEGLQIQKYDFPYVLQLALKQVTGDIIINGFKACGLVPWNSQKIIVTEAIRWETTVRQTRPPFQNRQKDMVSFFKILQEKIGEEKLTAFEMNNGEWKGPIEQKDLYDLWLDTKQSLTFNASNQEFTFQVSPITFTEEDNQEVLKPNGQESPAHEDYPNSTALNTREQIAGPSNVSSPFKRLLWPECRNNKVKKRKMQEKRHAAVTSPQMI